jgi:hypothetical protein
MCINISPTFCPTAMKFFALLMFYLGLISGLTMQANVYYKLLISWTNQKVKDTYVTRNTFDFKHGMDIFSLISS